MPAVAEVRLRMFVPCPRCAELEPRIEPGWECPHENRRSLGVVRPAADVYEIDLYYGLIIDELDLIEPGIRPHRF